MATLYDLRADLAHVIDGGFILDEETGEILFDADNLDELEAVFADKLEACGLFVKNLESDAKAIREEEKALAARRQALERKADRMKDYILRNMDAAGGKLSTPRIALSTRRSETVDVFDIEALPREFVKVTTAADKTAIKKAIKSGAEVQGADIVEKMNLQVK